MAHGFDCVCGERKKPVHERAWVVTQYKWNTGAFVKAGGEYSDYSSVRCLTCGCVGRVKSKYIEELELMSHEEANELVMKNNPEQYGGSHD